MMKMMKRGRTVSGLALIAAAVAGSGCASSKQQPIAQASSPMEEVQDEVRYSIVGAPGPEGPAGPAGAQGERGQVGEPGFATAGPRGETGPVGPTGVRGPTGAAGPEGAVAVGSAGVRGPAGPAGAQGARGVTGVQGASAAGYAGPAGAAGPQGAQGPAGMTGARGPTLVGPSGPAGSAGPAGVQGQSGQIGSQGSTTAGVAGSTGISGPAGTQGPSGPTGDQGTAGVIDRWTSYRDFWFEFDQAEIHPSDAPKVAEIAAYLRKNPSIQIGIDGSTDPRGSDPVNPSLRDRRISAVRNALIKAGISTDNIRAGTLGDPKTRRDRRVEVLIRTFQVTRAQ